MKTLLKFLFAKKAEASVTWSEGALHVTIVASAGSPEDVAAIIEKIRANNDLAAYKISGGLL